MKILKRGDTGPSVQLLQLGLRRAGYSPGAADGIFGAATERALRAFQSAKGLTPDGVYGPASHRAMLPYYLGYIHHTLRRGDTLFRVAGLYGSTVSAIETANPGLDPLNLRVGTTVVVPLPFDVVPTDIAWTSNLVSYCVRGLAARYPFISVGDFGRSVMGRPLYYMRLGAGENRVIYNASHHANEWITTPVLMKFAEDTARAYAGGGEIFDIPASDIFSASTIYIAPAVNPDGIDLVTGELNSGPYYDAAADIGENYPSIPFPSGWKANIRGTDLNLQYPAGWEQAKEIKFAQGFTSPAPRDYVGTAPLSAPESRGMYDFTVNIDPALTLSYHTQGQVIFWKYLDMEPPMAREIAEEFSSVSGYAVEDTPYASGFAGYKDWFVLSYDRPGYTIEAGLGQNPLPVSQFDRIYADNLGILVLGAVLTSPEFQ